MDAYLGPEGATVARTLIRICGVLFALGLLYYWTVIRPGRATVRIRPLLRTLALAMTVLVGLNALFAVGIVAVNATIPATALRARVVGFITSGQIAAANWVPNATGQMQDLFSDCIALSMNIVDVPDRGPLQMLRDADVVADDHPCTALVTLRAEGPSGLPVYNYIRYWHGYQVLTKPLMLLMDLAELRELADVAYLLAIVAFFLTILPARSRRTDAFFLSGSFILLTGAADEASALVHNIALLTTFLGGIAVHRVALRHSLTAIFIAAVVAASCAAFVDLIYAPPLVAMVLAIATMSAMLQSGRDDGRTLARGFASMLVAWGIGYLGTMVMRIVLSAMLLPEAGQGLRDFIGELSFRLEGKVPSVARDTFLAPVMMNARVVYDNPFAPFVVAGAVAIVLLRLGCGWRFGRPQAAGLFLLAAILPFPWYEIFRNHSEFHYWFTYVWTAFGLTCAMAALLFSVARTEATATAPVERS